MIVVDENLHSRTVMAAIQQWYRGQVISITALRPQTVIKDEAIPTLLQTVPQPTFVTLNAIDFWGKVIPHASFCILAIALPKKRIAEVPQYVRHCLALPLFKTKSNRMGCVIRLTDGYIDYYRANQLSHRLPLL